MVKDRLIAGVIWFESILPHPKTYFFPENSTVCWKNSVPFKFGYLTNIFHFARNSWKIELQGKFITFRGKWITYRKIRLSFEKITNIQSLNSLPLINWTFFRKIGLFPENSTIFAKFAFFQKLRRYRKIWILFIKFVRFQKFSCLLENSAISRKFITFLENR